MALLADMLETLTETQPSGLSVAGGTADLLQHIAGVVRDPRTDGSLARIWRWTAHRNIPIAIVWRTSHLREALRERMYNHPLAPEGAHLGPPMLPSETERGTGRLGTSAPTHTS